MHIANEVTVFLIACIIGVGFGVFYDLLRILRKATKHRKIAVFIEDLIFFMVATLITLFYMVEINGGTMRGFLIFGEILGAICYFFTASILLLKFADLIIGTIKKILRTIFNCLFAPIGRLLRKILSAISAFQCKYRLKIKKNMRKNENKLEKPNMNSI